MCDHICVVSAGKPSKASRVVHGGEMILQAHLAHHQSGEPLPDVDEGASLLIYAKFLGYCIGYSNYDSSVDLTDGCNWLESCDDFWYCVLPDPEVFTDG